MTSVYCFVCFFCFFFFILFIKECFVVFFIFYFLSLKQTSVHSLSQAFYLRISKSHCLVSFCLKEFGCITIPIGFLCFTVITFYHTFPTMSSGFVGFVGINKAGRSLTRPLWVFRRMMSGIWGLKRQFIIQMFHVEHFALCAYQRRDSVV